MKLQNGVFLSISKVFISAFPELDFGSLSL
jgi:hypothetical protein